MSRNLLKHSVREPYPANVERPAMGPGETLNNGPPQPTPVLFESQQLY